MSASDSPQQVSKPLLIVLGVVVGAAALYALYTFVLSPLLSGDEETTDEGTTLPSDLPTVVEGETPAPGTPGATPGGAAPLEDETLGEPVPETFEIFTARDPFQQLVVEGTAEDGTGGASTGDESPADAVADEVADGGTAGDPDDAQSESDEGTEDGAPSEAPSEDDQEITGEDGTDGTGGGGGAMEEQGGGAGEQAPSATDVGSTSITLTDVFVDDDTTEAMVVEVNGTIYEVGEGDVFADRFQVLDIDGQCATFLFGDSRFTLCEGETIVK